jgi:cytochrome c556
MLKTPKWGTVAAFAVMALVSGAAGVIAQDKAQIIDQRRQAMKAQGAAMGAVKGFFEGKGDQAKAQQGADLLVSNAPKIPDWFPAGTSMADFPGKTGAKAEIWQQNAKFKEAAMGLEKEAKALSAAVKTGDTAKIQAAFAETGKNGCGTCHNTFREKLI